MRYALLALLLVPALADAQTIGRIETNPGGSGAADEINRVIKANAKQIRLCYSRQLEKQPKLEGKVVVNFRIETDGSTKKVTVKQTTLRSKPVEKCIVGEVAKLKFAPREISSVVNYPFLFAKGG